MQRYLRGDLVQIGRRYYGALADFNKHCEAIIMGSCAEQYGGDNHTSYSVFIRGEGERAWYDEQILSLIQHRCLDLLAYWEREFDAEIAQKSDLDWIFSHGQAVLRAPHGASVLALAECFGLTDLGGGGGLPDTAYTDNALLTLQLAKPYLTEGDKQAWIRDCQSIVSCRAGQM